MRYIEKDKITFIRSSLTLMSGSVVAQIFAVCFSPVITRLYSEVEIGEYTLVLTAVSMFGSVICLRYDMAIVPENDERNVYSLIKLCTILSFIFSLFVSVGYSIYSEYKGNIENLSPVSIACWTAILLFFTGLGNILLAYNNRNKEYQLITSIHIIREVGRDVSLSALGCLRTGTLGLLCSQIVSVGLGLKKQSEFLRSKHIKWHDISFREMRLVAEKHKNQPIFSAPASFLNSFSYSLLNLCILNLYGVKQLAYYSMSFRMLWLPLALVINNMSKIFFEKASREYESRGEFRKVFLMTTVLSLIIAVPMVLLLMLFAPMLFGIFFGEPWRVSGEFVRYLAPMFGIRLVVSALSPTMTIIQKQNWDFYIQIMFLLAAICTYCVCKNNWGIEFFLILISAAYSVVYVVYYIYMFNHSKKIRR